MVLAPPEVETLHLKVTHWNIHFSHPEEREVTCLRSKERGQRSRKKVGGHASYEKSKDRQTLMRVENLDLRSKKEN